MLSFTQEQQTLRVESGKKVVQIDVKLVVADTVGQVNITDIMLQGGEIATAWVGHASELKWSFDG